MSGGMDVRMPGVAKSLVALATMDLALHTLGASRAMELADRFIGAGRATIVCEVHAHALAEQVARTMATAAAIYPRRALCLEQSLALKVLLRRRGVPAELKFGVQPMPFYAHAWIEVDGRPIHEGAGRVEQLVTFQLGG